MQTVWNQSEAMTSDHVHRAVVLSCTTTVHAVTPMEFSHQQRADLGYPLMQMVETSGNINKTMLQWHAEHMWVNWSSTNNPTKIQLSTCHRKQQVDSNSAADWTSSSRCTGRSTGGCIEWVSYHVTLAALEAQCDNALHKLTLTLKFLVVNCNWLGWVMWMKCIDVENYPKKKRELIIVFNELHTVNSQQILVGVVGGKCNDEKRQNCSHNIYMHLGLVHTTQTRALYGEPFSSFVVSSTVSLPFTGPNK